MPDTWFCEMNLWDALRTRCDDAEELFDKHERAVFASTQATKGHGHNGHGHDGHDNSFGARGGSHGGSADSENMYGPFMISGTAWRPGAGRATPVDGHASSSSSSPATAPITEPELHALSEALMHLGEDLMSGAIRIIEADKRVAMASQPAAESDALTGGDGGDEAEVDLEQLSQETLQKLRAYAACHQPHPPDAPSDAPLNAPPPPSTAAADDAAAVPEVETELSRSSSPSSSDARSEITAAATAKESEPEQRFEPNPQPAVATKDDDGKHDENTVMTEMALARLLGQLGTPPDTTAALRLPQLKPCNCKNSKCLKLYCDCFALSQFCLSECKCNECENTTAHVAERGNAVKFLLAKNPHAFESKIGNAKKHTLGCRCKKSKCLKKYCECYCAAAFCSDRCKCTECENQDAVATRGDPAAAKPPHATARTRL